MQIIPRGSPALRFLPPAEEDTLQAPEVLLQVARDLLQIESLLLRVAPDGSSQPDDLQHPILEMLQIILEMLRMIPDLLQVRVDLEQIDVDLQQNSGSAWPPIERRVPVEGSGKPGIRGMLRMIPDLQQNSPGMLQI